MTFRARPTTRTGRRSGHESDARRNLYFNLGFGAVVAVAVLLLVGAGAASWYGDHLAAVAIVNGETITKDALRARVAVDSFRLDILESRTREKVNAGRMSAAVGTQLLNSIAQQRQQVASQAYENVIDEALILQLAPKRSVAVTAAQIDEQVTKDATTPESRHTFVITVAPAVSSGAAAPTQEQKDAARKKAEGLLADLEGGTSWEDVVKASGDASAADTNGDLTFIDKGTTSPDQAFVDAVFALAAPGYTDVVEGADGAFRIGRVTEIVPAVTDPNYMKRAADAGVDEAAYRRASEAVLARDGIEASLIAEVVDKPSEQRRVAEMVLEDNGGQTISPGAVLVRHILYAPKNDPGGASKLAADDPAWKAAEEEAQAAYDELKAGTKRFVDLAAGSDDTGSASSNGFLPYVSQDDPSAQLDPAFAAAIFAPGLQPGQLLAPVKSAFGWHVIQFVTTDDPAVRAQKLIVEASKPGADFARIAADNSISSNAATGGEVGWVARYQLPKEQEDAIFGAQANALTTPIESSGLVIYRIQEVATRMPDPDQAKTLRSSAFSNWYSGIKNDPAQTTIERLISG
ncbi:MAG: peptidylprolyl isomerase [Chloroflexi bacterium]|nr:peptidylprolyl isomerase [Chloroflexota bacterium]